MDSTVSSTSTDTVEGPPAKRSRRVQLANARVSETSDSMKCEPVSTGDEERPAKTKTWEAWSEDVVNHFFDGLKMYGKDFEAITKHIRLKCKGECPKNHDQVRSHFYNTLSKVSSYIQLQDVNCSKEARELFPLINYMEWIKRTKQLIRNNPLRKEQFKTLVFKGSVFVKVKTGRGNRSNKMMIKTPVCPALRKYCEESRDQTPRCASEITVELLPYAYSDKCYVLDCQQNPLIRLQLNSSDSIAPFFNCIASKWLPPDVRKRYMRLNEDISQWTPQITLFCEKGAKMTSVKLMTSHNAPSNVTSISLERCIELMDGTGDGKTGGSHEESCMLEPSLLRDGLSQQNVGALTAGQLSLLYNGVDRIRLLYSVKSKYMEGKPEPWQCLMTLLLRDYGEAVHKATGPEVASRPDPNSDSMPPPFRTQKPISIPAQMAPVRGEAVPQENNHFYAQLQHLGPANVGRRTGKQIVMRNVIPTRPHVIQAPSPAQPPVAPSPAPAKTPPRPATAVVSMQVDPDADMETVLSTGHVIQTPGGSKKERLTAQRYPEAVTTEPKRQLDFSSVVASESTTDGQNSAASFADFFASPSKKNTTDVPPEVAKGYQEMINQSTNDYAANLDIDILCGNSNLSHPTTENSTLDTPTKHHHP